MASPGQQCPCPSVIASMTIACLTEEPCIATAVVCSAPDGNQTQLAQSPAPVQAAQLEDCTDLVHAHTRTSVAGASQLANGTHSDA
mmetsp:Transcript_28770/g.88215  ORF Transcript_28770/g.88215 Transcript_28770/m.88215 type:complete len:86 (+) Transcript_28770:563-820(+)|eukprot:scaffold33445_cov39-Tisochrysis_lutea.AAC.1